MNLDFGNLVDRYAEWLVQIRDFDPKTLVLHRRALKHLASFLKERKTPLLKPRAADLVAWINRRLSEEISRTTIKGQLCVFRTFYTYLADFGHAPVCPVVDLPEMICEPNAEQHYLTVAECRRLLDVFDRTQPVGQRNHLITVVFWCTGLRTSELCALRWNDIDFERRTLHVRKGKNRRQRILFLNDSLLQDLRDYRAAAQPADEAEPVFFAMRGSSWAEGDRRALTGNGLRTIYEVHGSAADIDDGVCPLKLRHTFATHMFERGASIEDLREMLGHTTATETSTYVHITVEATRNLLLDHMANAGKKGR